MRLSKSIPPVHQLNIDAPYPKWGALAAMAVLYVAPFITPLLALVAFAILVARIVLYDAKVFAVDYAMMVPITLLFQFEQMSLLLYLGLFASVWFFVVSPVKKGAHFYIFLIFLNYLILRMSLNVSGVILCAGQLLMMCVLLPLQSADSARKLAQMFCYSIVLSSIYALALRGSSVLFEIRGPEMPAYWGATLRRFQGLFEDPNYYMTLVVTAMTLTMKLFACGHFKLSQFIGMEIVLLCFGALTYSKTFFVAVLIMALTGIVWLYSHKKFMPAIICTVLALGFLLYVIFSSSFFAVLIFRVESGNLDDFTTGRSEVFATYYRVISQDALSTLFGQSLDAPRLGKDPHNLYLEITYYLGLVGLLLMITLIGTIVYQVSKKSKKHDLITKYLPLMMVLILYMALHGIFSTVSYAIFFLAISSIMIERAEAE